MPDSVLTLQSNMAFTAPQLPSWLKAGALLGFAGFTGLGQEHLKNCLKPRHTKA